MKSIAVISSGFLRNYRLFLETDFYKRLLDGFRCDFYIATWEEDGYGNSYSKSYTRGVITEDQIRRDFGDRLKFLHRESFAKAKDGFRYDPVMPLMNTEPHVIENYRSKFYMLNKVDAPEGYDAYFHLRFDVDPYKEMGDAILKCLSDFSPKQNTVYTAKDMFERQGCFGDIFQIFDLETFKFFQAMNQRLYDASYLSLDIPKIPERIIHHYFSKEMPQKNIKQIPLRIKLNRNRIKYCFFEDESILISVYKNKYEDEFRISKCGDSIKVKRTDADSGWGQHLALEVLDKNTNRKRMLFVGPSEANEKTVDLKPWRHRKEPEPKPKMLVVLAGEAFREGGQHSRKRDTEMSFEPQSRASASHMRLVGTLKEKWGLGSDIFISSYRTKYEESLLGWYGPNLLAANFKDEPYGLEAFMRDALWGADFEDYESALLFRMDLELKDHFMDVFDPRQKKIMFPSMCPTKGAYLVRGPKTWIPRISDTMMFVPKEMLERVRLSFHLNHAAWDQYNKDGISGENMGLMLRTFHDSDSAKDYNPLYRIAGRSESRRWHSPNLEAGENNEPRTVMKYVGFPDWMQPVTEPYEDDDIVVALKYDEHIQKETFAISVDRKGNAVTLRRTDQDEGWSRKVSVLARDKSSEKTCEIPFGASASNEKSVALRLSPETYEDENIKADLVKGHFPDLFRLDMHSPRELSITRIDFESGWGQDLSIDVEYKKTNRKVRVKVGRSESQTKVVRINDPILLM